MTREEVLSFLQNTLSLQRENIEKYTVPYLFIRSVDRLKETKAVYIPYFSEEEMAAIDKETAPLITIDSQIRFLRYLGDAYKQQTGIEVDDDFYHLPDVEQITEYLSTAKEAWRDLHFFE